MAFKSFHDHISENKRASFIFVTIFFFIVLILGYIIGEFLFYNWTAGIFLAFVFFIIYSVIIFVTGDRIMLGFHGAKKIEKKDNRRLWNIVEGLSIAAGIPMPKIYIINSDALNTFATGRKPENASIAVTKGLLDTLNKQELEGVIAHELSHIKNRDILFMMLVTLMIGIIGMMSNFFLRSLFYGGGRRRNSKGNGIFLIIALVFAILSPILAQIIRFAVSRKREYLADSNGALLTRYPPGLASALKKISSSTKKFKQANPQMQPVYISNPFAKKDKNGKEKVNLFSTHPPTSERIKRLKNM